MLLVHKKPFENGTVTLLGITAATKTSGNVISLNPFLFVPLALAIFSILFMLNFIILQRIRKDLTFEAYKSKRLAGWSLIPCLIGALNLFVWIGGMEMNIFGFVFTLPLLFALLIQFIGWSSQNWQLLRKPR